MLDSLIEAIGKFSGSIKKDTIEMFVDNIFKSINDTILPTFAELSASLKEKDALKVIRDNKQLALFSKLADLHTDNFKTIEHIHKTYKNLKASEADVRKVISFHFPKLIVSDTVKARDAAIVKLVQDLNALNMYTMDFLYYIMLDINETMYPKIKLRRLQEGLGSYVNLYKVYSKPLEKLLVDIVKMSDEEIPSNLDKAILDMKELQLAKHGSMPKFPLNGFIGNPIYHIRLWLVDRDFKKLEALEQKKQLIELRLMELKLEARGEKDPNLTKQIRYYEEKLTGLEYDIEKLKN